MHKSVLLTMLPLLGCAHLLYPAQGYGYLDITGSETCKSEHIMIGLGNWTPEAVKRLSSPDDVVRLKVKPGLHGLYVGVWRDGARSGYSGEYITAEARAMEGRVTPVVVTCSRGEEIDIPAGQSVAQNPAAGTVIVRTWSAHKIRPLQPIVEVRETTDFVSRMIW